ncbi:uncharacterized protein ARMOST_21508 [Armillaria ostoyae]|uniref:Uncharacterized protein n=1 Tax=Armillaria ostoyae TaxID=47428 RepID=A0A284SA92_ARMOS|nr:uncharacterized protein ARMOST_21508 [Armillaria ostoyae]
MTFIEIQGDITDVTVYASAHDRPTSNSPSIPRITPLCSVPPSPSYRYILSRRLVIPLPLHCPWYSDEDTH